MPPPALAWALASTIPSASTAEARMMGDKIFNEVFMLPLLCWQLELAGQSPSAGQQAPYFFGAAKSEFGSCLRQEIEERALTKYRPSEE
jgi:hypothetical protein